MGVRGGVGAGFLFYVSTVMMDRCHRIHAPGTISSHGVIIIIIVGRGKYPPP